jgi:hypothetical protein
MTYTFHVKAYNKVSSFSLDGQKFSYMMSHISKLLTDICMKFCTHYYLKEDSAILLYCEKYPFARFI